MAHGGKGLGSVKEPGLVPTLHPCDKTLMLSG